MKICVTASEKDLNAPLDPRFGRCRYFIIIDVETLKFETVDNSAVDSIHGAGVKAAQTVIEKGAETIITGNIGPNAYQVLSSNGIKIISGVTGTIKDVIERYKQGEFKEATGFTVPPHSGVGAGRGTGFKRGRGKGLK